MTNVMFNKKAILTISGTFVVPAEVRKLYVSGCAGGGGGSSCNGRGGGGGESCLYEVVNVTPGQSIPYVIGTGGLGCKTAGALVPAVNITGLYSGQDGSNTTFGDYLELQGGKGAISDYRNGGFVFKIGLAGGSGATDGQCLIMHMYQDAQNGKWHGGDGGHCMFGVGGRGGCNDSYMTDGGNGVGFGAGGGGGNTGSQDGKWSWTKAGNGTNGVLMIEW